MQKIYCIGDCMTAGVGADENSDYPFYLRAMLGKRYEVINKGRTGMKI